MSDFPESYINPWVARIERTPETPPLPAGLVRLDRNEHVGPIPERVADAMLERVRPALLSDYPNPWHFYQKLASRLGVAVENLLLVSGSDAAIRSACHVLVREGDRVGMIEPSYAMYPVYTRMFGGEPVPVPIRDDLTVGFDELMDVCRSVKLLFLANPNQPTGMLIEAAPLVELVRHAASTGTIVVVDEAYFPFSRFSVMDAAGTYSNLLVIRTFSKAYGLAGLRLGFVAGAGPLVKAMYKVRSAYDVNSFAVLCADYLLDHHEVVDDYVRQVWQGAELLQSLARAHGLEAPETATNFQLIKTAPRFDPKDVADRLRQAGYVIRGPVGDGVMKDYIRVTLGEFGLIERFADVLSDVLQAISGGEGAPVRREGDSGR